MAISALGNILIVDSDVNISTLLSINLRSEGFDVFINGDAAKAAESDLSGFKLIVADAMDAPFSGMDLLKAIKSNPLTSHIALIICTAHDSERLLIDALDAGADDYIVKPFSLRELIARIKAVIRRHSNSRQEMPGTSLVFHTLTLDMMTGRVTEGDNVLTLTKTEYAILLLLLKNVNNYVSRAEIYKNVWGNDLEKSNDRIVDTNISRLRKKLGDLGDHLINRTGLGYMMRT